MSVQSLVTSGPLVLAIPVAAAAGAVTFLSPCVLPLAPGYLSYITGMSGADAAVAEAEDAEAEADSSGETPPEPAAEPAARSVATETRPRVTAPKRKSPGAGKGKAVTGTVLFVLGFSFVFATYGYAIGGLGELLRSHDEVLTRIFGGITILLGLMFAGVFDRFTFAGRIFRPSARPQAGLAGAPLLGILFGFGWSPCIGPTLSAVLGMAGSSGTAGRGALLAFVYGLGLGVPFLIVAVAFQRVVDVLGFFRRNAGMVSRIGGAFLVLVGLLEITGLWTAVINWMHANWFSGYETPL